MKFSIVYTGKKIGVKNQICKECGLRTDTFAVQIPTSFIQFKTNKKKIRTEKTNEIQQPNSCQMQ